MKCYQREEQHRLNRNPDDVEAYANLGFGLLRQVRVSGDIALYDRAGQAFTAALARDPKQIDALVGQGVLALQRLGMEPPDFDYVLLKEL